MGRYRSTRHDDLEPVVCSVDTASRLLDQSEQQTMLDIRAGLLESYLQGRRRKVFVRSIHRLAEQRLREHDPAASHPQGAVATAGRMEKLRRERGLAECNPGK
jgi:hypothetical protein